MCVGNLAAQRSTAIIPGEGGTSVLKVTGTCRWTGYDFAVINISTGYLMALLRSSILAQGILWPSCAHQYWHSLQTERWRSRKTVAAISCSEWGGGGGTEAASFGHSSGERKLHGNSSVASFLVWGGGRGGLAPQMYRHKKSHVTLYMHERASQKHIGLYFLIWYGAINDSIGQTLTVEKIY